jgi:hypothetical protein
VVGGRCIERPGIQTAGILEVTAQLGERQSYRISRRPDDYRRWRRRRWGWRAGTRNCRGCRTTDKSCSPQATLGALRVVPSPV